MKPQYEDVLRVILEAGYASTDLLYQHLNMNISRIDYILDDLEFYDIVSSEDDYGIREVYISSLEEGLKLLERSHI